MAFLGILCSLRPDLVDLTQAQSRSNQQNLEEAFRLAEQELHIPRLLEPQGEDQSILNKTRKLGIVPESGCTVTLLTPDDAYPLAMGVCVSNQPPLSVSFSVPGLDIFFPISKLFICPVNTKGDQRSFKKKKKGEEIVGLHKVIP